MIKVFLPNTNPRDDQGIAVSITSAVAGAIQAPVTNDYCYCDTDCQYIEFAFADLADDAGYKNDSSSFLFDRAVASGTVDFELWKAGSKVADLNSNTYGAYYDGFTEQPLYKGFVIDWRSVALGLGFGLYQVRANVSILGTAYTYESRLFRLIPYSDEDADGTVRVTGVQQGNIIGGLDYTSLIDGGWTESFRIEGIFGFKEPELIQDTYQNSDYTIRQIRDEIKRSYKLETKLMPAPVANWLTENASLANFIRVTDYNLQNTEIFRDLEVKASGFDDVQNYVQKRRSKYVIDFVDRKPNLIKRNF